MLTGRVRGLMVALRWSRQPRERPYLLSFVPWVTCPSAPQGGDPMLGFWILRGQAVVCVTSFGVISSMLSSHASD